MYQIEFNGRAVGQKTFSTISDVFNAIEVIVVQVTMAYLKTFEPQDWCTEKQMALRNKITKNLFIIHKKPRWQELLTAAKEKTSSRATPKFSSVHRSYIEIPDLNK